MIEEGLYELMSTAEVKTSDDIDQVDFVLNLEVLNGCAHHCTGCFVNRRNSIDDVDLDQALKIAEELTAKGMRFREVILSPTDIFSADNVTALLLDTRFQQLLRLHDKTRITTTAVLSDVPWDKVEEVFAILDNTEYYREDMILEFLSPMEPAKVLARDPEYIASFDRILEFFKNGTPKVVDWSFVINIHYDPLYWGNVDEITQYAKEDYGTIIEFLPSFFRTGKEDLILPSLRQWNELVSVAVTESNHSNIMMTIADKYHNAMNTIVMNYKQDKLFISPFMYEQIVVDNPFYQVHEINADAVLAKVNEMVIQQYGYVDKTESCSTCCHRETCIGRNVISFMEERNLTECVFPKNIIELYHGNIPGRLHRQKVRDLIETHQVA